MPDVFRDRTMNLFTLSHTNANEFTFVISRATAAVEDTLQSVSLRLSSELQATLQDLSLSHARLIELNGRQALELFYSFKSGERIIFQKQRVVLTSENSTGKKLLCFIGTCPDAFDDYHGRIYDSITDSITFPDDAKHSPVLGKQIPADSQEIFFSFDRDSRELSVFPSISDLYSTIDLNRARNGSYLFFDAAGDPLMLSPIPDGEHTGRFALWEMTGARIPGLISSLLLARSVRGIDGLDTTEAVEAYLSQRMNEK
ncbi:DcrB-related protein [Enterobacter sp. Bisph1]|uniref:DcrB-related protein n=1 Tax=Enterobacter sp. Bisph1 TaxID=1274399 RepID=UPI001E3B88F2|nr:DcrB-related protein [Enterobacter sp. Bisph1]